MTPIYLGNCRFDWGVLEFLQKPYERGGAFIKSYGYKPLNVSTYF